MSNERHCNWGAILRIHDKQQISLPASHITWVWYNQQHSHTWFLSLLLHDGDTMWDRLFITGKVSVHNDPKTLRFSDTKTAGGTLSKVWRDDNWTTSEPFWAGCWLVHCQWKQKSLLRHPVVILSIYATWMPWHILFARHLFSRSSTFPQIH